MRLCRWSVIIGHGIDFGIKLCCYFLEFIIYLAIIGEGVIIITELVQPGSLVEIIKIVEIVEVIEFVRAVIAGWLATLFVIGI
tara:strand:- start:30355 stop:30603 length:249 start_codon:yes stop_codon:yes gene_type:complete